MTPPSSRAPGPVPPGRALHWFGEAIRLWKRGPVAFSSMAVVVFATSILLGPVPVVGLFAVHILVPLLACGLLYGSLAADRGERPRFMHMFMVFAAPLPAQIAVVAAAFAATAIESAVAWSIAGVNLLAPNAESTELAPSVLVIVYATDVMTSLPLAFVPMAVLFDGERAGPAFASSLRAFARNVQPMMALGAYALLLVLSGFVTMGAGFVLALPWIAAAQYAAWKDIYGVGASGSGAPGEIT